MAEILREASSTLQSAGASRWKAVLITPGKGSSGLYSDDVLREYGPTAFPKGTHSYVDHPKDGESRNPKNLFGVLTESAKYEEGIGLTATLEVMPHWAEFAQAVAPYTGLSIYAAAERAQTAEGYVVEKILPAIDNSVDLVSYAGRGGAMAEQLYESAIHAPMEKPLESAILQRIEEQVSKRFQEALAEEISAKTAESGQSANTPNTGKEKIAAMEIDTLAERVDALQESVKTLLDVVGPLAESLAEKQTKVIEEEKTPEIDFSLVAEACVAAKLPEAARKVVYNEVRNGVDPDVAIENQKKLVESIETQVTESLGAHRLRVGTDSPNQDFTLANPKWTVK
jgi:hypothetical protein